MEDNEKEEERTSSKTLAELEAESLRRFEQSIEITWQPIPNRHKVRVWIDDGTFKMVMSNEKFIKTLEDILMDNQSQKTYYNMRNIENSLSQYQGLCFLHCHPYHPHLHHHYHYQCHLSFVHISQTTSLSQGMLVSQSHRTSHAEF